MKKTLLAILSFATITAGAQQKNVFLDQAFWKTNPSVDAVKAEIAKGSNPAESNSNAFDGVVMAINSMAPNESIKFMLDQKGNEINKITHDSRTYIFWAANRGNVELVEYLLSKGARIDLEDSHGASPMGFAAGGGQANPKLYEAFFKAGADVKIVNRDGANLLMLGIASDKDLALTNFLVSKGLSLQSVDKNGNTVFNYAARTGNIKLLNTLLEKGVKYTDNAMIMAAQGTRGTANTLEVYEYLANLKIKPTAVNANGENVLHILARKPNQKEILSYFIAKGVNATQADNEGNTPFINAVASIKDTATLSLLLGAPKNINNKNKKGVSALALAVRSNSPEIVSYLLSKGADTKVADAEGSNLASYLVQSYSEQRVAEFEAKLKLLQDKGFAANTPQANGNTLYHLAVAKSDLALLKRVSQLSVDVNAKNKEGLTALHRAAMIAKDDAILKYLLSVGAKKDLTTEFKETAFDLAVENENFSKNNIKPDFLK